MKDQAKTVGAMRNLVVFERKTETQADDGSVSGSTWTEFARAMAAVRPVSAQEYLQAQQLAAETTHSVTVRWLAGLTTEMRIKYSPMGTARYLYIVTPPRDLDERHQFIEIRCKERES